MKSLFILLIFILTINYCKSQEKDFSELKDLYSELVEVFKSKNDNLLYQFCENLVADKLTLDFMRENGLCYKGVPCEMDKRNQDINVVVNKYFEKLLNVRKSLHNANLLDNLKIVDSVQYEHDIETVSVFLNKKTGKPMYETSYYKLLDLLEGTDKKIENYIELKNIKIRGTEEPMILKSGNKLIYYSMGEMASLENKKWSLWTIPDSDYYVKER
ncbi:hypothetical protein [Chryseobacterium binzhouense]|uniref:hypothetical protein n=1 Tax=Chryseobacterium binzhouense TaxID=2593646 RepID=UPI00289B01B4|nr:hypothetical protein [Chryseobacterium binzhouense]